MEEPIPILADKVSIRREMRAVRRQLSGQAERSARIWSRVIELDAVQQAGRLLAYSSIPGEPRTAPLISWAAHEGKEVAVPEDAVEPTWPDVVIVPGVAFTASGDRLGQGGGWYDRFLGAIRPDCLTIGVAFAEQIVDVLPVESHDIRVDLVITDESGELKQVST